METYSELTGITGSILQYTEYSEQALESRVDNKIASYTANKFALSEGPLQDISNIPSDFTLMKIESDDEPISYILENLTDNISFEASSTVNLLNYKFRQSSDESEQVIDAILVDTKNNMIRNAASSPFRYDFKFSENRNAYITGSRGGGTSGGGGY